MKLASQEVSEEKEKGDLRIMSAVPRCDEVFVVNAKLKSFKELTRRAREEFNLTQL